MSAVIALESVGFRYDGEDRDVLTGVDLQAVAGELSVVVGSSGSGKTTLGRIAAGLAHTLPGSLSGSPRGPARTGWVGPSPGLQRSGIAADVEEEIAFGLQFLGLDRPAMRARVTATAGLLGIEGLLGRRPDRLSSGEQQRVALASVLALAPAAVVLDDADAMLDADGRSRLLAALQQTAASGRAVLSVGGPAADLLASADATWRLADGRLAPGPGPSDEAADHRRPAPSLPPAVDAAPQLELRRAAVAGVLAPLDLRVERGISLGVAGPNGAGKTTLVELLSGLRRPDSGTVHHGDRDIAADSIRTCGHTVGHVFADPDQQLFARTVHDEVAFGLRQRRLGRDRVAELTGTALAAVGLAELGDLHPYELSYGDRKLLALAAVLALAPPVVVLDEPTATLDPDLRSRVGAVIEALRSQGRTVVLVSHDLRFLADHTDSVLTLPHSG